jgi:xanthine dehydrogenase accessory factor
LCQVDIKKRNNERGEDMIVVIRGGGDLASGVALRLYRCGLRVVITELAQPLAVRRSVSFAEAIYAGEASVEGVVGKKVTDPTDTLRVLRLFSQGQIPVLVDPEGESLTGLHPSVVVDARMLKSRPSLPKAVVNLIIGLGPGFTAGENCHVVIETNRGPAMGRVIWKGSAEPDTGVPEAVRDRAADRVLRAPASGVLEAQAEIGQILEEGQPVAEVAGKQLAAPFRGVLRGLIHPGLSVEEGWKIGDLDPRLNPQVTQMVSDKSLAVGGGVLEAILSKPELRPQMWK